MLLNMDWDSTAAIKEAEESDDPEVPAAVVSGWDTKNKGFYV